MPKRSGMYTKPADTLELQEPAFIVGKALTRSLGFEFVTQRFPELVNSLFDTIAAPIRRSLDGGMPLAAARRVGHGLVGMGKASSFGLMSSSARSTLINGGRTRTMVELTYHGYRRLVEPYKIEYYVREKDGVGNEFFWGFDATGGKSGKASIKRFFCDQTQSVWTTNQSFAPR